jgi:hypothetical protein
LILVFVIGRGISQTSQPLEPASLISVQLRHCHVLEDWGAELYVLVEKHPARVSGRGNDDVDDGLLEDSATSLDIGRPFRVDSCWTGVGVEGLDGGAGWRPFSGLHTKPSEGWYGSIGGVSSA